MPFCGLLKAPAKERATLSAGLYKNPALSVISSSQQPLKASEGVYVADSGVHGESVAAGNTLLGGGMTCPYSLAVDSELLDMKEAGRGKNLGRGTIAYSVQRSAGSRQNLGHADRLAAGERLQTL